MRCSPLMRGGKRIDTAARRQPMDENIIATSCLGDDLLQAMHHQDDSPCQMSDAEVVTTRFHRMTWWHPSPRIESRLRYGIPACFFGLKPGAQALAVHCAHRRVDALGKVAQALSTPVQLGDVECGAEQVISLFRGRLTSSGPWQGAYRHGGSDETVRAYSCCHAAIGATGWSPRRASNTL
jgi:hypothetical protein